MKASKPIGTSRKLVSLVHLARIRLTKAEGQLTTAKEMARVAKRRRKEAKQAARRTKKQAKLARQEVTDAKLALANAEAKLFQAGGRALARKASQARQATQTRARTSVTAEAARPSHRSPAAARRSERTVVKHETDDDSAVNAANRLEIVPEAATESPALDSLEPITTGKPVLNTTTESS